jgi:hypothetical protein
MSKLILTEFLTLDGVMQAPDSEKTHPNAGWVGNFFSPDVGQFKLQRSSCRRARRPGVVVNTFARAER